MINRQAKVWVHVALAAMAFLVVTGCEPSAAGGSSSGSSKNSGSGSSASAVDGGLEITWDNQSPDQNPVVGEGQTRTFTASGSFVTNNKNLKYEWTLEPDDPSHGTLNSRNTKIVKYTSHTADTSVKVKLTVKVTAGKIDKFANVEIKHGTYGGGGSVDIGG
ncbi:MAG: hypothetical protein ILM98_11560 [Kiritimatiellae bacterium]|nr:hypothetical protein [Kiritimatiellia bacterium]